ncbi:heme ABC exporter ATP-binding protein CcmA [Halobacillus campisalis]|uniref:Heme ABC exporter ATP-binding protein CcmA n=1 Tax=Halobacillus campisalis TaxID=435909 RepID=A0ABW2K7E2_9BACI|nr:heme ABC exporter ATP-binding protein CcmA [Halobacillus campisalis]
MTIQVERLSKKFRIDQVLNSLSFKLEAGEKMSIVGPSGSGKTTLLRILAGLEIPDQGTILLEEKDVTRLSARQRNIGLVFQQPLLFPHMTVAENIAYGAHMNGKKTESTVKDLLAAINLTEAAAQFPAELSGGQQQRVALARALAIEPEILLLDEPFSSLDPNLRQDMRYWVRDLLDKRGITSIFVTHDREEAMLMGDKIGVFHEGTFQQFATAEEIKLNPRNPFIVEFFDHHMLLNDQQFVHIQDIQFSEPSGPCITYEAELLQTTFRFSERVAHLYVKEFDEKITLPTPDDGLSKHIELYIPKDAVQHFQSDGKCNDEQ